jgi:type IV pilus assembly protein PilV
MRNPPPLAGLSLSRKLARGFTLVEVLIAIVILSFGVLGALGMQVNAIRMNKEVRYQATALSLARELAEKMRGNHVVAITPSNAYLLSRTLEPTTSISAPGSNCYTGQCSTGAEIAAWDIYEWQLRVRDALPSAKVVICMDSAPFDASGNPRWSCVGGGNVAVLKMAWNRASTTGETQFTADSSTLPLVVLPVTAGSSQ